LRFNVIMKFDLSALIVGASEIQSDIDKVVVYKPMVFRVNPRTGGYSEAPTINADKSNFMITLKRNI